MYMYFKHTYVCSEMQCRYTHIHTYISMTCHRYALTNAHPTNTCPRWESNPQPLVEHLGSLTTKPRGQSVTYYTIATACLCLCVMICPISNKILIKKIYFHVFILISARHSQSA